MNNSGHTKFKLERIRGVDTGAVVYSGVFCIMSDSDWANKKSEEGKKRQIYVTGGNVGVAEACAVGEIFNLIGSGVKFHVEYAGRIMVAWFEKHVGFAPI